MVWEAGKTPKVEEFYEAVRNKLKIDEERKIRLVKYFNYNFEWVEIGNKMIEDHIKGRSQKKNNKKENQNQNKNKNN